VCEKCDLVQDAVRRWLSKQEEGHESCWYYPEIFIEICGILGVGRGRRVSPTIPRLNFEMGCRRYQDEQYGPRPGIDGKRLNEAVRLWRSKSDLIPSVPPATQQRKAADMKQLEAVCRLLAVERSAPGREMVAHDQRAFMYDLILRYKLTLTLLTALGILHPEDYETVYGFADDFIKTIGIEVIPDA